ncbi:alpha-galactosidase [Paramicrobacterium agarici]|uniref:alpha-galactosidase n=1 Tax=Paramicrobacterium agarici TaxID=630514 RepID=UPI00114FB6DA|nr:alpha-galactosidase [Microbacterium agarici]TQO22841.1 alpha-galactosidase [Microbacterium agarici]
MTRVTFIGAGSVVFTKQLLTDLLRYPEFDEIEIALHDIDAERLRVAEATAAFVSQKLGAHARVTASADRRQALEGADFVINMIQVGGIEGTRADLEVPAKHGLLQTIGDTTGVGGVFRGLRTFPVLTQILRDMEQVCPNAYFLNYTNPMTMNVWWANLVAPSIRTIGLCHSVYWTAHDLAELVGLDVSQTRYRAAGLNHQSWLLEWTTLDGDDLYPRLKQRIDDDPQLQRRVRAEIFRRVGYYPTETSEHSAEYLSWFLRSESQREKYRLTPLEYLQISEENVAEFEHTRAALDSGQDIELENDATEYAPQLIHSIVTGTRREIHANIANAGLISNLPEAQVVEVPCIIDEQGVHPVPMGDLPTECVTVNRAYAAVAGAAIEAARTENPTLVRQALLADPNATSSVTPETLWRICDELTEAHARHLPERLTQPA